MTLLTNSFEGGTPGAGMTVGNSGGVSGNAFSLGATGTYTADSYKGNVAWVAAASSGSFIWPLTTNNYAYRYYLKIGANPTTSAIITQSSWSGGYSHRVVVNTTGKFAIQNTTGTTAFTQPDTLAVDTWYRVEVQVTQNLTTPTNGSIAFRWYLGDSTTPLGTFTSSTFNAGSTTHVQVVFGRISGAWNNGVMTWDDVALLDAPTAIGPSATDRFFLWDGTTEIPLTLSGAWDGSVIVPINESPIAYSSTGPNISNLWKSPQQVNNYLTSSPELQPIADQPAARWINNQSDADNLPSAISAAAGKTLLLCIYAIPGRDSGGYSGGGFADRQAYLNFITSIKNYLGATPAIISFEPDALGLSFGMTTANKAERIETLRQAVDILATIPNAETYIDASQWIAVTDQATALQAVDVHLIKGITLNTSGYDAQSSCYSYGNSVLAELATRGVTNKQYIIDSSRNGAGPLTEADRPLASPWLDTSQAWCNPPARLLGLAPGPVSGQPNCRATLWIKSPGESDGTFPTTAQSSYFGENAPSAGTFWIAAARSLLGLSPQKSTTGTVSDVKANFDSDWGSFSVRSPSATLVSGRGRVPVATTYDNIATTVSYTLKGGSIKARVYPPVANGATTEASVLMAINSATGGNRCIVWIDAVTNQIRFAGETGYWDAANVTIPYDATAHAWVRIREAGGVTYWDTSPDGSTWTQRKSATSLSWITTALDQSVQFVGYRDSGTTNYFEVDNVNF